MTATDSNRYHSIVVPDDYKRSDEEILAPIYPSEYQGHFSNLMLTKSEILVRIKALAELIHEDYAGVRPALICILKGASPFYHHLLEGLQELKHGYSMEFVRASSYDGTNTTGNVLVSGGLRMEDLHQRHVIVVEDIVDTGTTLSHLLPILQEKAQPKSLQICTLLEKRLAEHAKVKAKYVGFSIPDHFIVGFGLDYNELYRDVSDIWVMSRAGINFDTSTLNV